VVIKNGLVKTNPWENIVEMKKRISPIRFFLFLLASSLVIPYSFVISRFGGRPVRLILSDFVLLVLIPLVLLGALIKRRFLRRRSPVDLPFLLFLIVCLLGILKITILGYEEPSPLFNIASFLSWIRLPLFYFVAVNLIKDEKEAKNLIKTMILVLGIVTIIIFSQNFYCNFLLSFAFGHRWSGNLFSQEIFGYPNGFASFLVLTFITLLAFFLFSGEFKYKFLFPLLIIQGLYILFLFSRSAYLALAVSLISLGLLKKRIWGIFLSGLFLVVLATGIILFPPFSSVKERIRYTFFIPSAFQMKIGILKLDRSTATRLNLWKVALKGIAKEPFLGEGFSPFSKIAPYYIGDPKIPPYTRKIFDVHSQYIEMLWKTGIFGLMIFLWILGVIYKEGLRLLRITKLKFTKSYALGFLAGFTGLLFSNLTQANLTYLLTAELFWFMAGIVTVFLHFEKKNEDLLSR